MGEPKTATLAMQAIVEFILELDKLKGVTRKTRPLGLERYENSAEHSWQIALLAASLVHHAAETVDLDRVIRMLLVHDIGEIDTGDTMVYTEGGWEERKAAEVTAARRIFGLLPTAQGVGFLALWQEFEAESLPGSPLCQCRRPCDAGAAQSGERRAELAGERHQPRSCRRPRSRPDPQRLPGAMGIPRSASRRGAPQRLVRGDRIDGVAGRRTS